MDKVLISKLFKKNVAGMVPVLLKIWREDKKVLAQPSIMEPLYLTDNNQPLVYENNTYVPSYFKITLPEQSKDSVGLAKLTLGAVDLSIINLVRSLQTPLKVKFMAEYYEDGVFSRLDGFSFELINVSWNAMAISADLTFKSLLDTDFPSGEFSSVSTPGVA
jgi:hypothetical protein